MESERPLSASLSMLVKLIKNVHPKSDDETEFTSEISYQFDVDSRDR